MNDNIYYIEWVGMYTGNQYRLEVIPSGDIIGTPNYIQLPRTALELGTLSWEFQDLPLGINSDTRLKVTWNLDEIEDVYLISKLFNPYTEHQLPTNVGSVTYKAGNVYVLSINNEVVYRGVQVVDEVLAFDGTTRYEVELVGLGKYVLSCFDLKDFVLEENHMLRLKEKSSLCIFEYYDKYSANQIRTIISAQTTKFPSTQDQFHFWSVQSFENWLREAFRTCAAKILRRSTSGFEYTFSLPIADYYKQDYQGNQLVGTKLSKSELMLLTSVYNAKNAMPIGGLFTTAQDSLVSRYSAWWDFLSDLAVSEGMKLFVDPNGVRIVPMPIFGSNPTSVVLDGQIDEMKELRRFGIKQITVSLEEFGDEDVDNYRFVNNATRNENELQIPLLFNNAPPANDYQNKKARYGATLGEDTGNYSFTNYISDAPCRIWNYYYFDQPVGMTKEVAFGVHDFCRSITSIRNGVVTGVIAAPSMSSIQYSTINDPKRYCLAIQRERSKALMFKDIPTYYTEQGKACRLKVEKASTGELAGAFFLYTFSPSSVNPYASGYPTEYHLTKVEFDFEKEVVSMELFGYTT